MDTDKELAALQKLSVPRLRDRHAEVFGEPTTGNQSVLEGDGFLYLDGQQANKPRNREGTKSANLRKPELLPPQEIRAAIEYSVTKHAGLFQDELPETVARLFGFRTTTANLRERIESAVQGLAKNGVIELRDGRVQRPRV